jgi:hypothetical protein
MFKIFQLAILLGFIVQFSANASEQDSNDAGETTIADIGWKYELVHIAEDFQRQKMST